MKIWQGYSSEHSMNLVMIGHFEDATAAAKAKQEFDWLSEQVLADVQADQMEIGSGMNRYTKGMLELLGRINLHSIGPSELEQFGYDFKVKVENSQLVLTTDESDVSAFLKVLLENGARVEVYSAHDYPETGYGR